MSPHAIADAFAPSSKYTGIGTQLLPLSTRFLAAEHEVQTVVLVVHEEQV